MLRDLDAFAEAVGRPPDFVGSPGEVHVLPVVREALFRALAARGLAGGPWLRDPSERLSTRLRRRTGLFVASAAHRLARGSPARREAGPRNDPRLCGASRPRAAGERRRWPATYEAARP